MAADQRVCRIDGCATRHARNLFCCRQHWYALPKGLRDAIWRAYHREGPFSEEYAQAAEDAEAFLEDREAVNLSDD